MLFFATQIASPKLTKKIQSKLTSSKTELIRGIRAAQKSILKGEKGILILANDISPTDLVSHFPALAEEHGIPVIYVSDSSVMSASNEFGKPTAVVLMKGEVESLVERWTVECASK
ncbi:snoRNA-binding protein [Conglomerata obtusa]